MIKTTVLLVSLLAALPAAALDKGAPEGATIDLVAGSITEGRLDAALVIDLKPGWKTYWRTPGDSGISPLIESADPAIAEAVEIAYPTPHRFGDRDYPSLGYTGRVVLPLKIALKPGVTAGDVKIKAFLGLCREICLPVEQVVRAGFGLRAPQTQTLSLIADARARLPRPATGAAAAIGWEDGSAEQVILRVPHDTARPVSDVFAEGDFLPDQPVRLKDDADVSHWRIKVGGDAAGKKLTLTIVTGDTAREETHVIPHR